MPSKGTPRRTVRMAEDLVARIKNTVARRNQTTRGYLWEFSDFVRVACEEKLAKMSRCRTRRARLKPRSGEFS